MPSGDGRLHAVQTRGAHPLERAYRRLAGRVAAGAAPADALAFAANHRSEFMWSWEEEPHSIAHGILDDETYDWFAVERAMFDTGGSPVVVDEDTLLEANHLARSATGIDVDPTGSAGLAGLLHLVHACAVDPAETVGVIFTGVRRSTDNATTSHPPAIESRSTNPLKETRS
jgi:threonine synthase